jgi:hypothetical protein
MLELVLEQAVQTPFLSKKYPDLQEVARLAEHDKALASEQEAQVALLVDPAAG